MGFDLLHFSPWHPHFLSLPPLMTVILGEAFVRSGIRRRTAEYKAAHKPELGV